MIPFQITAGMTILLNGYENLGHTISFFMTFYFLPLFFFTYASKFIDNLDLEKFYKFFKLGVFLIAVYGIFLFFCKILTGKFLEIPFLTANFHDLGELENKNIQRGSLFKLISTYNNGNIYGACILMLLPLYCYLEKSPLRQWILKASIILTLSRTAWFGLIFCELLQNVFIERKSKTYVFFTLVKLLGLMGFFYVITILCGFDFAFIFDKNLGGRDAQFSLIQDTSIFSSLPFNVIAEIVYLSILAQFGIIGLFFFIINMVSPLFFSLISRTKGPDRLVKYSITCGLVNYLFICLSDGATLYIPTMVFYWFLSSLLLRRGLYPPIPTPQR